ncbi:DivIVA domain-containing protein [Melissospora conviva]|uniref:DivIVA domain-containing protein n=1 Tax=Melissospora conviva TaxID=3388432 RepID=UPI003C16BD6E
MRNLLRRIFLRSDGNRPGPLEDLAQHADAWSPHASQWAESGPAVGHVPAADTRKPPRLPLLPWQVRHRRFSPTRWGRRGVDPAEVDAFLQRIADDLTTMYAQLANSRDETLRIKDALRDWQSRQARNTYEYARR